MRFRFRIQRKPVPAFRRGDSVVFSSSTAMFTIMTASQLVLFRLDSRRQFGFPKTDGLFAVMLPSVGYPSLCIQSAQVSGPFSRTQLCMGKSVSQRGVLVYSRKQPKRRLT